MSISLQADFLRGQECIVGQVYPSAIAGTQSQACGPALGDGLLRGSES